MRLTVVVWLKEPETPVMVTVLFPVAAVLLTTNVSVLVLVVEVGLNDAVTPVPRPEAEKVTLPAKPLDGVIVIFDVSCDPRLTFKLAGEADSVKLPEGAAVTVRVTVVVCMRLPLVPVTVIVYVPVAVVEGTVMVMVEVPAPAMDEGLKPTVTPPAGWTAAVKSIAELKAPEMVVVIVDVPWPPWTTETELGEAEMAKLGDDEVPASALIRPTPFGLPQPVAKSYPVTAE